MPATPADRLEVTFASLKVKREEVVGLLVGEGPQLPPLARQLDNDGDWVLNKAAKEAGFNGKSKDVVEILVPTGLKE